LDAVGLHDPTLDEEPSHRAEVGTSDETCHDLSTSLIWLPRALTAFFKANSIEIDRDQESVLNRTEMLVT
jgi:hypothetical protein